MSNGLPFLCYSDSFNKLNIVIFFNATLAIHDYDDYISIFL